MTESLASREKKKSNDGVGAWELGGLGDLPRHTCLGTHPLAQRLVTKPIGPDLGTLDKRRWLWGLGDSKSRL